MSSIHTDRKKTAVGKHWSAKDRIKAVAAFLVVGNMARVSESTGIPLGTLNFWKTQPWWFEQVEKIRAAEDQEIDNTFTKIVKRTQEVILDRLDNGDWVVTGDKLVRKPVAMRDAAIVNGISMEKRKLLRDAPVLETKMGMSERLKKLEEQFTKMVTMKTIDGESVRIPEGEVIYAEQEQEASESDGSGGSRPSVREEGQGSTEGSERVQSSGSEDGHPPGEV